MKDDYLWDKSGEPDPEIQHMERVLGQLRGERNCRELMPAFNNLSRAKPRMFSKVLAIAAALAFAVLALGTFSVIQRQSAKQEGGNPSVAMVNPESPEPKIESDAPSGGANETKQQQQGENDQLKTVGVPAMKLRRPAFESRRRSTNRSRELFINEREQAEGLMAKEQLIKALQITSSKLNSVQKQVQGEERQGPSS